MANAVENPTEVVQDFFSVPKKLTSMELEYIRGIPRQHVCGNRDCCLKSNDKTNDNQGLEDMHNMTKQIAWIIVIHHDEKLGHTGMIR